MSKYTTQVRWIIENATPGMEGQPIVKRIQTAAPLIFNFDFPMWSESYRGELEKKILMHYFNKEIGLETVGLWKLYLEERLNLIMPYYNEVYKTTAQQFDYLNNVDMTESYTGNETAKGTSQVTGESSSKSNTTSDSSNTITDEETRQKTTNVKEDVKEIITDNASDSTKRETATNSNQNVTDKTESLNSDLPQANYARLDYGTVLKQDNGTNDSTLNSTSDEAEMFKHDNQTDKALDRIHTTNENENVNRTRSDNGSATGSENVTANNSSNGNTTNNKDNTYNRIQHGLSGSKSRTELMLEFRNSLINIDMMVINELKDLFMMVY